MINQLSELDHAVFNLSNEKIKNFQNQITMLNMQIEAVNKSLDAEQAKFTSIESKIVADYNLDGALGDRIQLDTGVITRAPRPAVETTPAANTDAPTVPATVPSTT